MVKLLTPTDTTDTLVEIEGILKKRLGEIKKSPIKNSLEIMPLELALLKLYEIKVKVEKGEQPSSREISCLKEAVELAEMGAGIDIRVIMHKAMEII